MNTSNIGSTRSGGYRGSVRRLALRIMAIPESRPTRLYVYFLPLGIYSGVLRCILVFDTILDFFSQQTNAASKDKHKHMRYIFSPVCAVVF